MSTETLAQALARKLYDMLAGSSMSEAAEAAECQEDGILLAAAVLAHFGVGSEEELTRAVALSSAAQAFLAADPVRQGHEFRPVDARSVPIIAAANATREEQLRSVTCWDCSERNEQVRWNSTQTIAEHQHLIYTAWIALRAAGVAAAGEPR